jgi:SAM-dependent methyltransferase
VNSSTLSEDNKKFYLDDCYKFVMDFDCVPPAERYFQRRRYENIIKHLDCIHSEGCLLDIGCGHGVIWKLLSEMGRSFISPIGVELSLSNCLAFQSFGLSVQADAEFLPFISNSFNAILVVDIIEHLGCPRKLIQEFVRVTQNDGYVLISTPNKYGVYEHKAFYRLGLHRNKEDLNDLRHLTLLRGKPSSLFPQHVSLYGYGELITLMESYGLKFVAGARAGFALPGFGWVDRLFNIYSRSNAARIFNIFERLIPQICWNMVLVFRK